MTSRFSARSKLVFVVLIFSTQAQLESKNAEVETLKATISQAESAMMQISEQSQAIQDQLVDEGKRKMTKLKEQQKKKIAQLKAEHSAIVEGVYTRSVDVFSFCIIVTIR